MNWQREQANANIKIFDFVKQQNLQYRVVGSDEVFIVCPFHPDKNPSCSVSLTKKIFHCFGCQITGDYVFLMAKLLKKSTDEVINLICLKYGIQYPSSLEEIHKEPEPDEVLIELIRRRDDLSLKLILAGYLIRSARRLKLKSGVLSDEARLYYDVEIQYELIRHNLYCVESGLKKYCLHVSFPFPKFSALDHGYIPDYTNTQGGGKWATDHDL